MHVTAEVFSRCRCHYFQPQSLPHTSLSTWAGLAAVQDFRSAQKFHTTNLTALCDTRHREVLTSLTVKLGAPKSRFSAAVEPRSGKIKVAGVVRDGRPFLSEIGNFDVDVALEVNHLSPGLRWPSQHAC